MYNNNLTNEEEQFIDNILTSGLEEIKEINPLQKSKIPSTSSQPNETFISTINNLKKSSKPKSSALKNLIHELKQGGDYAFSSDEECKEEALTENEKKVYHDVMYDDYNENEDYNIKKIKTEDIDLKKIENNTKRYNEMKDDMLYIKNKIEKMNNKISKSVNTTKRNIKTIPAQESTKAKINGNNTEYFPAKVKKKNLSRPKKFMSSCNSLNSSSLSYSSIKRNLNGTPTKYASNVSYKSKYLEVKEKYNLQKEKIASEEESINHLEKKIKQVNKKNKNFEKLVEYNKQLFSQEELLKKQIVESETIRKEQSKLIRSLQREIDMLRGEVDTSNLANIAEIYQEMKESLLKSGTQSQIK